MYVALGALKAETREAALKAMPACYTPEFDRCLEDRNRQDPRCRKYEPVHVAYEQNYAATDKLIEALPYCEVSTMQAVLGGAALIALGIYLGKRTR